MKIRFFNLIKGNIHSKILLIFITQFAKKNSTLNLKTDMKYEESNHTLICFRRRVSLSPVLSFLLCSISNFPVPFRGVEELRLVEDVCMCT